MEPPLPGGTGTGPAGPAGRHELRPGRGWSAAGSPDQLQQLEACRESAGRDRTLRASQGPEGTLRVSPPLPVRISWAFPPLPDGTPFPGAWRGRGGAEGKGTPEQPATQATLEKPKIPETPPLSSPRSPTSAPAFRVPAADSPDHEEQPLPRLQRSHEEDARQARGCEAPFPLDEGLAVRPEAEQVSVQVAWRRGREDHSEEGGGAGE